MGLLGGGGHFGLGMTEGAAAFRERKAQCRVCWGEQSAGGSCWDPGGAVGKGNCRLHGVRCVRTGGIRRRTQGPSEDEGAGLSGRGPESAKMRR